MRKANNEAVPRRCGLYLRISKYEGEGRSPGTVRQEKDCRAEARRRGWQVVEPIYLDDDRSALKRRPRYEDMVADLKAGVIDAVIAWHEDRLLRSNAELEDLVVLVEATGAQIITVCAGDVDLETPEGRFKARIQAAVARKESEDKSRRLRRMMQDKVEKGEPNGGGRPYGYRADRVTPEPAEAAIVVEVVARVAAGETLTRVAEDLNRRGVPTARGARWNLPNIRRMCVNPRYIGRRTHHGTDVGEALWPALVDETTWRRAQHLLTSEDRPKRRSARKYLLSGGLLVCGACGTPLRSKPSHTRTGPVATYACPPPNLGGCAGVNIRAEPTEELITEEVIRMVEKPAFAKALRARSGSDRSAVKTIRAIEAERDELAEALGSGAISMREFKIARAKQDQRLAQAQSAAVADQTTAAVARYAGRRGALREEWSKPEFSLDRKQAIIRAVIDHVVIDPVGRSGGKTFNPDRVQPPVWRV
jgi:DNA invertase Pin-like site-specific DNA recombinase